MACDGHTNPRWCQALERKNVMLRESCGHLVAGVEPQSRWLESDLVLLGGTGSGAVALELVGVVTWAEEGVGRDLVKLGRRQVLPARATLLIGSGQALDTQICILCQQWQGGEDPPLCQADQ